MTDVSIKPPPDAPSDQTASQLHQAELGHQEASALKNPAAQSQDVEDTAPMVQNYTDGYAYEVPRPFLTLHQAAGILGMTLRSLERSIRGRWGSKLPDGWLARKMKTSQGDEWRILPPPGFRVKMQAATEYDTIDETETELVDDYSIKAVAEFAGADTGSAAQTPSAAPNGGAAAPTGLFNSAANLFNKRPSSSAPAQRPRQPWRPDRHSLDQPTIVIDRTEEVEHLLRELVTTKGALAEERRVHLEDVRMITQLQSSMRLLEVNAADQAKLKSELEQTRQELMQWQQKYVELSSRPWWQRVFKKS
jgi:hypothetical protein